MEKKINLFWFRRDLRLHDNRGLYEALSDGLPALPVFIFDSNILKDLPEKDLRVQFIWQEIEQIRSTLLEKGKDMFVFHGTPEDAFQYLLDNYKVNKVFTNRDYEPYAKARDKKILSLCNKHNVEFESFKDHVIFHQDEVVKKDGDPYTVFTPYKNKWLERLRSDSDNGRPLAFHYYPSEERLNNLYNAAGLSQTPSLESMGFSAVEFEYPSKEVPGSRIKKYDQTRNFPAIEGTSRLGIHFRFGTISIREKAARAIELNETYLSELIWRDFYAMILDHYPKVVDHAFKPAYDNIKWRNNDEEFKKWCEGKTGYPLVDAGMRQLNETGYMHNRVRMVTASFLTKHLLIDWRWGEAYFAEKLLDFDLSSNNGGWQWAAGSGTDAAPYFRIFNPASQLQKFDKDLKYIKSWVPEYGTENYPSPIVDHKEARQRCLDTYKEALSS